MSRSKARIAADWFAKLRINEATQVVEHTDVVAVEAEVADLTTQDVAAKLDASSYTAADVLTKIKTVDGAGSGLDADTLDGQSGAYYTDYTDTAIANLVATAPTTLDTLNELAAALGDDPNFATTVSASIGTKLDASSYTAADVLSKILTVDGAGSGLDADTLDGNQATAFATAAQGALADSAVQPNDSVALATVTLAEIKGTHAYPAGLDFNTWGGSILPTVNGALSNGGTNLGNSTYNFNLAYVNVLYVSNEWAIYQYGNDLTFNYSGSNKMKLDTSGNLTVVGNVTAYGTI